MEGLTFGITLYLISAFVLFVIFSVKYHQDKPWYTWGGKYTLRQTYWIGFVSIAGIMLFAWWYVVANAAYHNIRSIFRR